MEMHGLDEKTREEKESKMQIKAHDRTACWGPCFLFTMIKDMVKDGDKVCIIGTACRL